MTSVDVIGLDACDGWVAAAQSGDLQSFELIVRTLQGPVRSFARRMMRDAHLGDDAAQETFLRLWKGLASYRPGSRFTAWAFAIARNTCIEALRREARTAVPMAEMPDAAAHGSDPDVARMVAEAIDALGEPYRSAFLLRETGLNYEEIADALGCPIGTVRSRLHEARRRLAERLGPLLAEEAS